MYLLLNAFQNEGLGRLLARKRHELISSGSKLRNVGIHSLYSSNIIRGQDSSVTVVTLLHFGRPRNCGSVPSRCIRSISSAKRPGPSHEVKLRRREADCSPHLLLPRLRITGAIPQLPHTPLCGGRGQLYFSLHVVLSLWLYVDDKTSSTCSTHENIRCVCKRH